MSLLSLIAEAAKNPVFSGAAGFSIVGGAVYALRFIPSYLYRKALWLSSTTVSLRSDNKAYWHFLRWLSPQIQQWHTRNFTVIGESKEEEESDEKMQDEFGLKNWRLSVGYGDFWLWRDGRPYHIEREAPAKESPRHEPLETIKVRAFGFDKRHLAELLKAAEEATFNDKVISIYQWAGHWKLIDSCEPRRLDTINLPYGMIEDIIADVEKFKTSKEFYARLGIPWRHGILFQGIPGTGKSSVALALAGYFKMPLYALNLSTVDDDSELFNAFSYVPKGGILLIEDVDAATNQVLKKRKRGESNDVEAITTSVKVGGKVLKAKLSPAPAGADLGEPSKGGSNEITLSGLLNTIDGVVAKEGRLLIMTTNHKEMLDPALLRPGRVDREWEFGLATRGQARGILRRFFPEFSADVSLHRYAEDMTPAEIQGACQMSVDWGEALAKITAKSYETENRKAAI